MTMKANPVFLPLKKYLRRHTVIFHMCQETIANSKKIKRKIQPINFN